MRTEKKQIEHKHPTYRCEICNKCMSIIDYIISNICGKCTDKQVELISINR